MEWHEDPALIAHYVLWVAEDPQKYRQPGDFAEALVRCAFRADRQNSTLLAKSYPVVVETVRKFKDEENGYLELRELALSDT
jgi:hypothetical protein